MNFVLIIRSKIILRIILLIPQLQRSWQIFSSSIAHVLHWPWLCWPVVLVQEGQCRSPGMSDTFLRLDFGGHWRLSLGCLHPWPSSILLLCWCSWLNRSKQDYSVPFPFPGGGSVSWHICWLTHSWVCVHSLPRPQGVCPTAHSSKAHHGTRLLGTLSSLLVPCQWPAEKWATNLRVKGQFALPLIKKLDITYANIY